MPTRKDLARWLVNAAIHRVPLSGFADHRVSESVYLDDPEGNGIEVYADRDPSLWQWSDGTVTMATDQLDIDSLVSLTNTKRQRLRQGARRLAHRAHASARRRSRQGRRLLPRRLGFDPTRARNGAAFLSSGRYHHHLGLNVWQSAGAGRRDDAATGLAWFSLEIDKPDLFAAKEERLRQTGVAVASSQTGSRPPIPGARGCASSRSELVEPASGPHKPAFPVSAATDSPPFMAVPHHAIERCL